MKIAANDQLKLIDNGLKKRSLIPVTQNYPRLDHIKNTYLSDKIDVKNLPRSGLSKLSINNLEIEKEQTRSNAKVISHYDTMSNSRSNIKRYETFNHPNKNQNSKHLTQLKKNASQRFERPIVKNSVLNSREADLKSQTILIRNRATNSQLNKNDSSSLSSLMSSSLSSASSCSLSSETSIVNKIEETKTLFDLINSIKLYLKKIEVNYSVDNLFNYLKVNIKTIPDSKLTIDYLEQFKYDKTIPIEIKNKQKTDTNSLPSSQLSVNYPVPLRSLSQLKPSVQLNYQNKKLINSTKPIKKLFKHLNLFRCLYHIMQRDLIVNVFLLEIPKLSNDLSKMSTVAFMSSNSNDQKVTNEIISDSSNNETIKPSNYDELIYKAKTKVARKLRHYHEKIYNLNETLSVLINDTKNSDIKLLSKQSILPVKYEYFKHGEFVLRLTNDIVKKFTQILNYCQKAYYLNHKLNSGNLDSAMRLNNLLESSDEEQEQDHTSKLDNEIKRDTSVLKSIQRKKTNLFQKLPTIGTNSKSSKLTPIETDRRVRLETPKSKVVVNMSEREKIIKKLTKQDSLDSFIRETDTSSILSENDYENEATYHALNENHSNSDDLHEESNYLKHKVSSMNSVDNPDNLLEEYRIYKQKLEISQSTLRNLNFYLDNLVQRVDRYNYLEMQLKNDNELIKRTEMSLKQYQIDNMIEMNANTPSNMSSNSNNNNNLVYVTKNSLAINLAFRKQLERQLDFLKYRFKLNLQDFNVEKVCLPEINYAIMDTEKKLANLSYYITDLNKYLIYIESRLSEQFLNMQMRQQHQQKQQQHQKAQIKKPVTLTRHSSIPAKYFK